MVHLIVEKVSIGSIQIYSNRLLQFFSLWLLPPWNLKYQKSKLNVKIFHKKHPVSVISSTSTISLCWDSLSGCRIWTSLFVNIFWLFEGTNRSFVVAGDNRWTQWLRSWKTRFSPTRQMVLLSSNWLSFLALSGSILSLQKHFSFIYTRPNAESTTTNACS